MLLPRCIRAAAPSSKLSLFLATLSTESSGEEGAASNWVKVNAIEARQEMLSKLQSLKSTIEAQKSAFHHPKTEDIRGIEEDFFNVRSLFTLRDLFEARVHLGHHMGCWNELNKKYLHGIRNKMHIISLPSTEQHLWRALNVVSLIAFKGGSILFVNNKPEYTDIVQEASESCSARHYTAPELLPYHGEPDYSWFTKEPPDVVICSSVNNPNSQKLLLHCNKYLVPTIGILDSDVNPTNLTYVIPGNDDSTDSVILYHKLFAKAILRAKHAKMEMVRLKNARETDENYDLTIQ